jgi:DNA primase
MIPESFIQELLNRVDVVDVIDKSVPLKKAGANYSACSFTIVLAVAHTVRQLAF